jgi:DNA repair exonuclease SbcCD ATPase subunit
MAETQNIPDPTKLADETNTNGGGKEPEKVFTQAELNQAIEARLERERKKQEANVQKARDEAAAENAKKNGEWQTLAEQREARIKELEPVTAKLDETAAERDQLRSAVESMLKEQTKDLPAHVVELLSGLSPLKQLDWIAKNAEALRKKPLTVPGTPQPDNGKAVSEAEDKDNREKFRAGVRSYF